MSGEFDFLNRTSSGLNRIVWSLSTFPRLWLYHLNYFDFVNLDLNWLEDRPVLRKALQHMVDWCEQNSTGREVGWEPYPLSLRIVNWLKFLLRNTRQMGSIGEKAAVAEILSSLRCQVLALEQSLEFHLRANHLLKNIKALMFAGALLDTYESNHWWKTGAKLLDSQLREQILPDGGHFERSPMYHAEALEDLLDLEALNVASGRSPECAVLLSNCIGRMADFLETIAHPDGKIPLFNDAAFRIVPALQELLSRAGRRNVTFRKVKAEVKILPDTGYAVIRDPKSGSCLIFDCGHIGPDNQPGHAHCDVLSYELSLDGCRVVVDTGVSGYEPGVGRQYERSTAAHNTLRIDGEEQAEIWAAFRVGRRPKVSLIESGQAEGFRFVRGSHQGYRRLGAVHTRQIISCPGNCWVVVDDLQGKGTHRMESFVHFHPDVQVEDCLDSATREPAVLRKRFVVRSGRRCYFFLSSCRGTVVLKDTWYSPEFGRREKQRVIYWCWEGALPAQLIYAFVPVGRSILNVSSQDDQESIKIDNVRIPLS